MAQDTRWTLIPRGAIAGHGGILKLILSKKDRRRLEVHCFGEIASEVVGMGQMVIHFNGMIDTFLEKSSLHQYTSSLHRHYIGIHRHYISHDIYIEVRAIDRL